MPRNPQANFYLKRCKDNKAEGVIFLQFHYKPHRLRFSFGQRIALSNWNKAKQRVKNTATTTADGNYNLNQLLETLAKECERAYKVELSTNGVPLPENLGKHLQAILDQDKGEKQNNKPTLY